VYLEGAARFVPQESQRTQAQEKYASGALGVMYTAMYESASNDSEAGLYRTAS
jgi:hypothetical protein